MGRQIYFHMLPEDRDAFLEFVQRREPVIVTERSGRSAQIQPVKHLDPKRIHFLCLWHRGFLPELKREFIPESDEGPYYRIDDFKLPVLEFSTSLRTVWEGKPALGQGRLYGSFEDKPAEFEEWYEALVRWIRKNFRRSPAFGGCAGPAAYEFYKKGGYLLPFFRPPKTKEWLAEIRKRHQMHRRSLGARV